MVILCQEICAHLVLYVGRLGVSKFFSAKSKYVVLWTN